MNLTKEVKDLHAESYKTLVKEIKNDSKKQKGIPSGLGLEKLIFLKWPEYPKQSTDLM